MENRRNDERREPEIVFSRAVKAGKRIYYLDVKKARNEDLYLCITESKRKSSENDGSPIQLEKHRLFLYKEDFAHFKEGLNDVIAYVESQIGEISERPAYEPRNNEAEEISVNAVSDAEVDENPDQTEAKGEKKGFFSFLKK